MPYSYDLFISYRRKRLSIGWMSEHFLPLFLNALEEAVFLRSGRELGSVFLDIAATDPSICAQNQRDLRSRLVGIPAGVDWKRNLLEAIPQARCLLALWSPTYFGSHWCLTEWDSYRHRAAGNFAVPITIHDCFDLERVPKLRDVDTDVQAIRFDNTYLSGSALVTCPEYIELQKLCNVLASCVAERIHAAGDDDPMPLAIVEPPEDDDGGIPRISQYRLIRPPFEP